MRWGIRADASDDHSTVDLCLRELDACKKLSFGTFFVVSERFHYYIRLILLILYDFVSRHFYRINMVSNLYQGQLNKVL